MFAEEDRVVTKFLHQNKGRSAEFLTRAKIKYAELQLYVKNHQSLSSIKKMRTKENWFLFSCPTVYLSEINHSLRQNIVSPPSGPQACGQYSKWRKPFVNVDCATLSVQFQTLLSPSWNMQTTEMTVRRWCLLSDRCVVWLVENICPKLRLPLGLFKRIDSQV